LREHQVDRRRPLVSTMLEGAKGHAFDELTASSAPSLMFCALSSSRSKYNVAGVTRTTPLGGLALLDPTRSN